MHSYTSQSSFQLQNAKEYLSRPSRLPKNVEKMAVRSLHTKQLMQSDKKALFPSSASIGRRYMSASRLPLKLYFLYYFIHPWTTLAKGFRSLLMRGGRNKKSQGSD